MLRSVSSLRAASRSFATSATASASSDTAAAAAAANATPRKTLIPAVERRRPAKSDASVSSSADMLRRGGKPASSRPPRQDRSQPSSRDRSTDRQQPPSFNRRRSVLSQASPSAAGGNVFSRELPSMTTSDVTAELPDLSVDWSTSSSPTSSTALAAIKTYPYLTLGAPPSPASTQGTTLARATFEANYSNAQYEARRKEKKYRPLRTAERALRIHLGPNPVAPGSLVLGQEEHRDLPAETAVVEGGEVQTMGDAVKEARVRRERAVLEKLGGDYARYGAKQVLKAAGGETDVKGAQKWVLRDAARAVATVDRLDPVGKSWVVSAIKGEMR